MVADIAWMAGLFEGEGTIGISCRSIQLRVVMTDKDIIERFHKLAGCGKVRTADMDKPYSKPHYKQQYAWYCAKREDTTRLLMDMLPYFGERRAKKALDVLDWVDENAKYKIN
jgi:hypothetical protein